MNNETNNNISNGVNTPNIGPAGTNPNPNPMPQMPIPPSNNNGVVPPNNGVIQNPIPTPTSALILLVMHQFLTFLLMV